MYGYRLLDEETKILLSFGIRLSLELLSTETIETLIAHSLAYCTFVSQDRCTIKCNFLSEPVVAEVAKEFLKDKAASFGVLKHYFLTNHLNIGDIGETVSQIIFLRIYDYLATNVCKTSNFKESGKVPVNLKDFLQYFWPSIALKDFPTFANDYCLFFNHFIELEEQITFEILTKALRRCCALKLMKNCKGADLAIPLFNSTEGFGTKVSGILWIQIKTKQLDPTQEIETSLSDKLCSDYILGNKKTNDIPDDIKKLATFGIHFTLVADVKKPLYFADMNYVLQTINSFRNSKNMDSVENINDATVKCFKHVCPKLGIKNYNAKGVNRDQLLNSILESVKKPTLHNLEYYFFSSPKTKIYNCCCYLKSANEIKKLFTDTEWQALLDILSVSKQTSIRNTTFDREASVKSYLELHNEEVMRLEHLDLELLRKLSME